MRQEQRTDSPWWMPSQAFVEEHLPALRQPSSSLTSVEVTTYTQDVLEYSRVLVLQLILMAYIAGGLCALLASSYPDISQYLLVIHPFLALFSLFLIYRQNHTSILSKPGYLFVLLALLGIAAASYCLRSLV